MGLQTVIQALFPAQCLLCETWIAETGGLCPECWRETDFLTGVLCESCATPLPGLEDNNLRVRCDACLQSLPPWGRARAVVRYAGQGRRLVLSLKQYDRTDIAPGAAAMMLRAAHDLLGPESLLVPVPLHWTRMAKRRYNQSALLAQAVAQQSDAEVALGALRRPKRTRPLFGLRRDLRAEQLDGAITVAQPERLAGRPVVVIDDVLTTGATLAACATAALEAGAARVDVAVLARAAHEA